MILTCPECKSRYVVNPNALMPNGRTVRCAKCSHNWFESKPEPEVEIIPPQKPTENEANNEATSQDELIDKYKSDGEIRNKSEESDSGGDFDFPIQKPKKRMRPVPKTANLPALQNQKYGSSKFGWISLMVFVTAVISLFLMFQDTISSKWPASNKLYTAIGLNETQASQTPEEPEISPIGERLLIKGLSPSQENRNNVPYLIIRGNIENITDILQTIPRLKVILLDANRNSIREWDFASEKSSINPEEIVTFETSLPNPPVAARDISVLFTAN
ncbi:MAG: DUF3426 domain-containing protein [Kordiimonadaceae bacterium]|jgi:predicted Zn finger-like uncharacterized protein|nr:DUF3426 domain-containing protein [Kordiimonadaceae bacterium]MBT6031134.1 DUF3426 domain-containing protein [Kordiimonadaceae bacterium]